MSEFKKVIDWPSFGPKMKIRTEWRFLSLDEPRFHWLLDTTRGQNGYSTPTTHKYVAPDYEGSEDGEDGVGSPRGRPGVTVAKSGLISRGGYIRIIREDISVPERDVMISELKALAKTLLTGRNASIFERHALAPLLDPLAPKPGIQATADQFNISEQRVYKIITKCWKKIESAHRAAQAKEEAPIMLTAFAAKRQTGGLTYQDQGRFWEGQLRAYTYSTSINTHATAASTKDLKDENG